MTDTPHHDYSALSARKRQAIFRATHRGTREMDILLGGFVEKEVHTFTESEMNDLDALMQAPDWDIYKWVTGTLPVPGNYDTPLFRRWSAYQNAKSGEMRNL
ncbi:MAG: succinate dehydrogenase assembly factor 2 [Hyphomicrobiales bacterium]